MNDNKILDNIKQKYEIKERTKLDDLRSLDKKVYFKPRLLSYILGSLFSIIMGLGMSIVMTDFSYISIFNRYIVGIIIGVIGLIVCLINYPLYKYVLNKRKCKYRDEILKLSNELISEK